MTKLSSKSRRKTQKLNNSDEDFQSVIEEKKPPDPKSDESSTKTSTKTEPDDVLSVNILPPCPFCGKSFNAGQELTRASHLKSCGNQLGLDTNQLLKIKHLEDRQADEWRALNLPKIANSSLKNTSKNTSKSRQNAQFQASGDPLLDMALAMSASMVSEVPSSVVKENKCWLPQPPPSSKSRSKSKAKTTLQVRTTEERNKQIGDALVAILTSESIDFPGEKYHFQPTKLGQKNHWWWSAANLTESVDFYVDFIKPYLKTEQKLRLKSRQKLQSEIKSEKTSDFDQKLAKDWLRLLECGSKSDLIIYVRGEEMIQAHELVLMARCSNLLDGIIEEAGNDKKILSIPEVSKNVMMSFLKYLYGGQVYLVLEDEQDLEDAKYLAKLCPQLEHWKTSISDQSLRGFISDSEENSENQQQRFEESKLIASQNLSNLLNILEEENSEEEEEENDEEWNEVCQYLSQQSKDETHDENLADQPSGYESPDLFEDSEPEETEAENGNKRKSSLDFHNESKRSRIEIEEMSVDFNESCWQNCTVYSRKNDSPEPSILNDLSLEDTKRPDDENGDSNSEPKSQILENLQSPKNKEFKPSQENGGDEVNPILKSPKKASAQKSTPLNALKMPSYEKMLSPALRLELRRFGLKVIPRQKAVPLLKHIYEETHPEESVRRKVEFESEELDLSLSSQESTNSEVILEESILDDQLIFPEENESLHQKLLSFIRGKPDLHRQVLMYEPLWLEDLFQQFKLENPTEKNMKINQLQDMLDTECITFRTRARHDKNVKRNARK